MLWTLIVPHAKRGNDATTEIDILPHCSGILAHDHWKPYYRYERCLHSLCNAHHQRELTRAFEQDNQQWAGKMAELLNKMNIAVKEAEGCLVEDDCKKCSRKNEGG